MNDHELHELILKKGSFLCVGLDSDINRIPDHLKKKENPQFEFNKRIIDATIDMAVAYKLNTAFYESRGGKGWEEMEMTAGYLRQAGKEALAIADAKRGDIGNTSAQYAKAFLENLGFDALTVNPYMGEDSVGPFLQVPGKWIIILALTSNKGSCDFQHLPTGKGEERLFEKVLRTASGWGGIDRTMFVVGATQANSLEQVRKIVPEHFLLVPGVGAQGGSLEEVARYGMNSRCGLLVNSSRGIIFASGEPGFDREARKNARALKNEMEKLLTKYMK